MMIKDSTEDAEVSSGGKARDSVMRAVSFDVEVIVGEAPMTFDELGALGPGEVVTLSASLNEAVRLRLNGVDIARGELVSAGNNFAVRITDVAD